MSLLAVPAFAQDAFICIAESAAGFSYDAAQKTWRSATFRTDSKYVVNKSKSSEEWEFKPVGEKVAYSRCSFQDKDSDKLVCHDAYGWEFRMDKYNLRFLYLYKLGYWDDRGRRPRPKEVEQWLAEGKRQPHMEIGKCSPL
jgi:hypothetical protein